MGRTGTYFNAGHAPVPEAFRRWNDDEGRGGVKCPIWQRANSRNKPPTGPQSSGWPRFSPASRRPIGVNLSLPFPLRFLLATHPELIGRVLGIIYRMIAGHLIRQTGHTQQSARTVAVTLIQRFGFKLRFPWARSGGARAGIGQ